jgi:hypothetical protein
VQLPRLISKEDFLLLWLRRKVERRSGCWQEGERMHKEDEGMFLKSALRDFNLSAKRVALVI